MSGKKHLNLLLKFLLKGSESSRTIISMNRNIMAQELYVF